MGAARLGRRSRPKPTTEFRFAGGELDRWACLGAVTDRSVRLWLRDPRGGPRPATLEIDSELVARCELDPAAEHDWIAAADLTLARPRPDAVVSVQVEGVERRARLAPTSGVPTAFTFAFGSCHQPFETAPDGSVVRHSGAGLYSAMARTLRARDARFLLLLGDQVYSDGVPSIQVRHGFKDRGALPSEDEIRAIYRRIYRGYFNEPGFRALLEGWPTSMIWDDHDICEGWGSMLEEDELDRRLFRAAEAAYREYQHLHNDGTSIDDTAPYHYHSLVRRHRLLHARPAGHARLPSRPAPGRASVA